MSPGRHEVELAVGETTAAWTFDVTPEAAALAAEEGVEPIGSWGVEASITGTAPDGDGDRPSEVGSALSARLASRSGRATIDLVGDLSARVELDGDAADEVEQSGESWVLEAGSEMGAARATVRAGYATPSFLDTSELLDSGLARGGVGASLGTEGRFRVSGYTSFDPAAGEVAGGELATRQDLSAGAVEIGGGGRFSLQATALEVADEGDDFEAPADGRALGLMGRLALPGGVELTFEGARGELEPGAGSFDATREGNAYSLGLSGNRGAWTFALRGRRVEADFVNPASPGLTPAGRADREALELDLGRSFSTGNLSFRLERLSGGDGFGPAADVGRVSANLSAYPSTRFGTNLSVSWGRTEGEADPQRFTPAVERDDLAVMLSFDETLGKWRLNQRFSIQEQSDRFAPAPT